MPRKDRSDDAAVQNGKAREDIDILDLLGMSQKEIAAVTEVTTSHLSHFLKGERNVSPQVVEKLEQAVGDQLQRVLAMTFDRFHPEVKLLATDKGGNTKLDTAMEKAIVRELESHLAAALVNRVEVVSLPEGIYGVLVRVGPLYCILIDQTQAKATYYDVLLHEVQALIEHVRVERGNDATVAALECMAAKLREATKFDGKGLKDHLLGMAWRLRRLANSLPGPIDPDWKD